MTVTVHQLDAGFDPVVYCQTETGLSKTDCQQLLSAGVAGNAEEAAKIIAASAAATTCGPIIGVACGLAAKWAVGALADLFDGSCDGQRWGVRQFIGGPFDQPTSHRTIQKKLYVNVQGGVGYFSKSDGKYHPEKACRDYFSWARPKGCISQIYCQRSGLPPPPPPPPSPAQVAIDSFRPAMNVTGKPVYSEQISTGTRVKPGRMIAAWDADLNAWRVAVPTVDTTASGLSGDVPRATEDRWTEIARTSEKPADAVATPLEEYKKLTGQRWYKSPLLWVGVAAAGVATGIGVVVWRRRRR